MRICLELKVIIIFTCRPIGNEIYNFFFYKRKVYGKVQTLNNSQYLQYLHFTAMRIGYSSRPTFGYETSPSVRSLILYKLLSL